MDKNQKKLLLLVGLATIILVTAAIILAYKTAQIGSQNNAEQGATDTTGATTLKRPPFPLVPPEEDKLFSYTGAIELLDLSNNKFSIATERGMKTIIVSDKTKIVRLEQLASVDAAAGKTAAEQPASLTDLQKKVVITVQSEVNIKGETSFEADKIIILPNI